MVVKNGGGGLTTALEPYMFTLALHTAQQSGTVAEAAGEAQSWRMLTGLTGRKAAEALCFCSFVPVYFFFCVIKPRLLCIAATSRKGRARFKLKC